MDVTTEALGQSESFLDFQDRLSRVAPIERPVLILGERGTGKELAAARLHYLSKRWQAPFVTLNCASLSPSLVEAELFGHEKGAFTGAAGARAGRFETAASGTLFLDEIGSIPMEVQEKILRVVEYGSFERVGSSKPIETDVRIISATNADLSQMAEQGSFKPDLLDRLSFEVLFLPPLRSRKGDISLLAKHFAGRMAYELGRESMPSFSSRALLALNAYPWKGNVRELKNVVERAVYRADASIIDQIVFNPFVSPYDDFKRLEAIPASERNSKSLSIQQPEISYKAALASFELSMIQKALDASRHNQKQAARALGLTYDQFRGLYRKHKNELQ